MRIIKYELSITCSCVILFFTGCLQIHAEDWTLERAKAGAERGDAQAQFVLGLYYQQGKGVPQDLVKAAECYRRAAEQGNMKAQTNLGSMLSEGAGVPKNEAEAAKWFRKAAEQGSALAADNLGQQLLRGEGIPKDANEAKRWFIAAAEQDFERAQFHLGRLYYFGDTGVERNYAEAFKWLLKAATHGDAWSQNAMGSMLEDGLGVARDIKQAIQWYHHAARQDNAKAQASLGRIYTVGAPEAGIARNPVQAYFWLKLASDQDEVLAVNMLAEFQHELTPTQRAEAEKLVKRYRAEHPQRRAE